MYLYIIMQSFEIRSKTVHDILGQPGSEETAEEDSDDARFDQDSSEQAQWGWNGMIFMETEICWTKFRAINLY